LSGNVYIERVPVENSFVKFLKVLRSDRVSILIDSCGAKMGFEYKCNGKAKIFQFNSETGASPILHLKTFHPLNDWYGMSPIEAAARAIDQHNAVGEHNLSILQNGGRPSGALMVKASASGQLLTAEQRENIRQDIKALYEGTENAGRIMVIEGNCEWKGMGFSPVDLDFKSGKNMSAREIAQAFGVPPVLVGLFEDATFSNYKEARLNLWEETMLPLLDYFVAELNRWLAPIFGDNLAIGYDKDAIPALAAKRDHTWNVIQNSSFLTINEKRQALGYGPIDDGDRLH
jgi:HK97 family phage portal protein